LLPEVVPHWRQMKHYFAFFMHFAQTGIAARRYLLSRNAVSLFLHIYLGPDSPNIQERIVNMGTRWEEPDFSTLISCVSVLVRSCNLPRDTTNAQISKDDVEGQEATASPPILRPPTRAQDDLLPMSEFDFSFLVCEAFIKRLIMDKSKSVLQEAGTLLSYLVWENCANSDIVLQVLRDAITHCTFDLLKPLFVLMEQLLAVEDSYMLIRVSNNVRDLLEIFEDKKKLPKSTEASLKFLIHQLYENNPTAREYLNQLYLSNFGSGYQPLAWIEYWLETHQHDIKDPGWFLLPPPEIVETEPF